MAGSCQLGAPQIFNVTHLLDYWYGVTWNATRRDMARWKQTPDEAYQVSGFQDFVVAHELLHLRIPNHGRLFKALMTAHIPGWRLHDVQRAIRVAGK
jgi:Protein of unknown function DUF45